MSFPSTNWTQLALATLSGNTASTRALDSLLSNYRAPVVNFLRQQGKSLHDAEDLTHQLFLDMMQSKTWRFADRSKGRFRSFVLGILAHVISGQQRHWAAQKRGDGAISLSLEELTAEGFEQAEPTREDTQLFDRQWALRLVANALSSVEEKFSTLGKQREWAVLVRFLPGAGAPPTHEAASAELGVSVAAMKTAVHRVRNDFREALRRAVACTVSAAHEVEDELAYLHRVLSSPFM